LEQAIQSLELAIQKARNKQLGLPPPEEPAKEPPSFPLLDIPDSQLDEEGRREKRKQRLLKAGHDAREKARVEREEAHKMKVKYINI
jgi:actin-related protein 5